MPLTEEERKERGRRLAEGRLKAKVARAAFTYSNHIVTQAELRKLFNASTDDYETTIAKLIESRHANIQSMSELTGMSQQEVIDILQTKNNAKYRQNY